MSHQPTLNSEQYDQMKTMFSNFDKNGDGAINQEELKDALAQIGNNFLRVSADDAEIKRIMKKSDIDGNGLINFEEFVKMMSEKSAIYF